MRFFPANLYIFLYCLIYDIYKSRRPPLEPSRPRKRKTVIAERSIGESWPSLCSCCCCCYYYGQPFRLRRAYPLIVHATRVRLIPTPGRTCKGLRVQDYHQQPSPIGQPASHHIRGKEFQWMDEARLLWWLSINNTQRCIHILYLCLYYLWTWTTHAHTLYICLDPKVRVYLWEYCTVQYAALTIESFYKWP